MSFHRQGARLQSTLHAVFQERQSLPPARTSAGKTSCNLLLPGDTGFTLKGPILCTILSLSTNAPEMRKVCLLVAVARSNFLKLMSQRALLVVRGQNKK